MKHLYLLADEPQRLIFRGPDDPEGSELAPRSAAAPPQNPRVLAERAMAGINDSLGSVDTVDPETSQLLGDQLPQLVSSGIGSPEDLERLSRLAHDARADIRHQMAAGQNPDQTSPGAEISPEALQAAEVFLDQVQAALDAEHARLAALEHPSQQIAEIQSALYDASRRVEDLRGSIRNDPHYLATLQGSGGAMGDLEQRVAQIAESKIGMQEGTSDADSFNGVNTVDTPWCRAFVNAVIREAGGNPSDSLMAREATGQEGLGHIGIKVGDRVIAGNSSNQVRYEDPDRFEAFNSVDNMAQGQGTNLGSASEAPEIAIVTKSRSGGSSAEA